MNLTQFDETYKAFKSADKIEIKCDHPEHNGDRERTLGKQPARRNIIKNDGEQFICRECMMKYDNPMQRPRERRQTDEVITVSCPHSEHDGDREREIKKSAYFGPLDGPFEQICKSCAQFDKEISEEQREAISKKLKGRELSDEHRRKISEYMKTNEEGIARGKANLVPGMGGIARAGLPLPQEWKDAISDGTKGKPKSLQHRLNISEGRKKMLVDTGGFTKEHREAISRATVEQYARGFDPQLHHLKGWHSSPKAGRVFYRSSYEKKAYMMLDADPEVKTYYTERVKVEYSNPTKGITSTYLIDIDIEYNDGRTKLIEVKPEKWLEDTVVVAKIEAAAERARDLKIPFRVWTETYLFGSEKEMREFVEWLKKELGK